MRIEDGKKHWPWYKTAGLALGVLVVLIVVASCMGALARGTTSYRAPGSGGVAGLPVPSPAAAAPRTEYAPAPAAPVSPGVTPAVSSGIGDGTYEVGAEIQPGKYKTTGGSGCYWARQSSADEGDIISNHFGNGPTTVVLKASDKFFRTSGCDGWSKVAG